MITRAACLTLATILAGCGGSRTSSVEGTVLLDGKPLAGASIQFVPEGAGRDATGQTDTNGQFTMSTFEPKDGVLPGTYKVTISPPLGAIDPKQYASSEEAMSAAKPQPKKASTFPQKYSQPGQTPLTQEVPVQGKVTYELSSK
jgi:hypothetical protein